jgi:hypothetical protein
MVPSPAPASCASPGPDPELAVMPEPPPEELPLLDPAAPEPVPASEAAPLFPDALLLPLLLWPLLLPVGCAGEVLMDASAPAELLRSGGKGWGFRLRESRLQP